MIWFGGLPPGKKTYGYTVTQTKNSPLHDSGDGADKQYEKTRKIRIQRLSEQILHAYASPLHKSELGTRKRQT